MKKLWLLLLAVIFIPIGHSVFAAPAVYTVQGQSAPVAAIVVQEMPQKPPERPVWALADKLIAEYGNRPMWPDSSHKRGWVVPPESIQDVEARLLACESSNKDVKPHLDKNGKYSYGRFQYQTGTWQAWSKASGITGDPENVDDALKMTDWALGQGLLHHWGCAYVLHILE